MTSGDGVVLGWGRVAAAYRVGRGGGGSGAGLVLSRWWRHGGDRDGRVVAATELLCGGGGVESGSGGGRVKTAPVAEVGSRWGWGRGERMGDGAGGVWVNGVGGNGGAGVEMVAAAWRGRGGGSRVIEVKGCRGHVDVAGSGRGAAGEVEGCDEGAGV
ncbi:hypothetical protein EDB85DRAFT_1902902 [Lactarius pseudohatsudake]|nr:hypothetical protein EDB85DRAFT_1902902 [Lactarius pseudohatsudake]